MRRIEARDDVPLEVATGWLDARLSSLVEPIQRSGKIRLKFQDRGESSLWLDWGRVDAFNVKTPPTPRDHSDIIYDGRRLPSGNFAVHTVITTGPAHDICVESSDERILGVKEAKLVFKAFRFARTLGKPASEPRLR